MRARIKRRQRIRTLTIVITIAVIAVSLIVAFYFIIYNTSPYRSLVGKPVSASDLGKLTGVSDSTLATVGRPSGVNPPVSISGSQLTLDKKPEVLYIGGDYCPYCAIERWSLIIALSRFGQFSGLTYMLSSATDQPSNVPTFSFGNATYTSSYVSFVGVEEFGQDPTVVVQPLTSQQQSILSQYDVCAANGNRGGIPFVDIANSYVLSCGAQSGLNIAGQNWTEILNQLNTPTSNTALLIDGAANTVITAICNVLTSSSSSQPPACSQTYANLLLSFSSTAPTGSETIMAAPEVRLGYV